LKGENAEDTAAIVKEVIDRYLELSQKYEAEQQAGRLNLLYADSEDLKRKSTAQREKLSQIAKARNAVSPLRKDILKEDLNSYLLERRRIKLALSAAKAKLHEKTKRYAADNQKSAVSEITQLKEEVSVLELQEKELYNELESLVHQQAEELAQNSQSDPSSYEMEITEQILKRIDTAILELNIERRFGPRIRILQQPMAATTKQN
jgi:hypothetical protein